MYLATLITRYTALGLPRPSGLDPVETDVLERALGQRFPMAYREFLYWGGNGGVAFFTGSDYAARVLPHLRTWAGETLEEDAVESQLPDDALVFWMHQGYMFRFFRAGDGDDPPTFFYRTGSTAAGFRQQGKLSTLLTDYLEWHADLRDKHA